MNSTGQDFLEIARGYRDTFPDGDRPLHILARLTEELGEVAEAVAHLERHGAKVAKHGEPSIDHLAEEIQDLIHNAFALVRYYSAEAALDDCVQRTLDAFRETDRLNT
ncbi:NTP pyrophosphatase (non-canonical NTP hydrolase) [Friedmanniella endophytica]|uniref:NTP pyrophosphatase (Non-canonical NTP hydrolase) n=1 Tax=Microlunatus kandeliicorticis TaxID=1759536 RepID=A0A7W3IRX2_9ACTN|nr:MazG nucleotide pyrophosphohydrolase domain-containing protein [Microlunatus kandeliicorticis]MBA8794058.1 NTP pyrophosphatase (non-canonical NTP hydrolase) [Microlunatus kandeliicorticis]